MNERKAHDVAMAWHKGQEYKKRGVLVPYSYHLMGVVYNERIKTDRQRIIAWLHDILEDTEIERDTIRNMFGPEVANIVYLLTKKKDDLYMEYIRRIMDSGDVDAMAVKAADLRFNIIHCLSEDGKEILPGQRGRFLKYLEAIHAIEDRLNDILLGNRIEGLK